MATIHTSSSLSRSPAPVGRKRPPQSRRDVLSQVQGVNDWLILDNDEDLQICMPPKRIRLDSYDAVQARSLYEQSPTVALRPRNLGSQSFDHSMRYHVLHSVNQEKRSSNSLVPCLQAQEITKKEEEQETARKYQGINVVGCRNGMESADGWSFKHLNNHENMVRSALEDDQEEARELASMTNKHLTPTEVSETAQPDTILQDEAETGQPHVANDGIAKSGQERSRYLRERALARQSVSTQKIEEDRRLLFDHGSNKGKNKPNSDNNGDVSTGCETGFQHCDGLSQETMRSEPDTKRSISVDVNHLFEVALHSAAAISGGHDGDDDCSSDDIGNDNNGADSIAWIKDQDPSRELQNTRAVLHAASRAAAEQYRTQSRHLEHHIEETGSTPIDDRNLEELERRLRVFTSRTQPTPATPPENPLVATFQRHDLTPSASLSRSPSESNSQLRQTTTSLFPPLKQPTMLSICQQSPLRSIETSQSEGEFSNYPSEPPDLTLPKGFDQCTEEQKDIIKEHETQKERLRDLEAIVPAFEQTARAGALNRFGDVEAKEIQTMQQFKRAVLDQGLSGKTMRRRINEIRANMSRRILKFEPSDEFDYRMLLDRLLPKEQCENIAQLIYKVRGDVERLAALRSQRHSKCSSKTKKKKSGVEANGGGLKSQKPKHVRFSLDVLKLSAESNDPFADLPDGAEIELPGANTWNESSAALTERKRYAQYTAADKRERVIRNKLEMFTRSSTASDLLPSGDNRGETHDSDGESEVSEEEDGAELFTAAIPAQDPTTDATDHEDTVLRDKNEVSASIKETPEPMDPEPESSQAHDARLASCMQRSQEQRAIMVQQNMQIPDCNLLLSSGDSADEVEDGNVPEQEMEREFDDIDDSDYDGDLLCHRYIVKAQYAGVPGLDTGTEYYRSFLDPKKAAAELVSWIEDLRTLYKQLIGTTGNLQVTEEISENGELSERIIELGPNGHMSCRAWIEKEEYNPSKIAYQNAKVRRACRAKPIYTVRWEKIIKPVTAEQDSAGQDKHEAENETTDQPTQTMNSNGGGQKARSNNGNSSSNNSSNDDDDDNDTLSDLFNSPPPPPTPNPSPRSAPMSITTTTTTTPYAAHRFFTNIALANRHAKDIFMQWYRNHHQNPPEHGAIRREEDATERQVESYGNKLEWEREDDVNYYYHHQYGDNDEGIPVAIITTTTNTTTTQRKTTTNLPSSSSSSPPPPPPLTLCNEKFRIWVESVTVTGPAN